MHNARQLKIYFISKKIFGFETEALVGSDVILRSFYQFNVTDSFIECTLSASFSKNFPFLIGKSAYLNDLSITAKDSN